VVHDRVHCYDVIILLQENYLTDTLGRFLSRFAFEARHIMRVRNLLCWGQLDGTAIGWNRTLEDSSWLHAIPVRISVELSASFFRVLIVKDERYA